MSSVCAIPVSYSIHSVSINIVCHLVEGGDSGSLTDSSPTIEASDSMQGMLGRN